MLLRIAVAGLILTAACRQMPGSSVDDLATAENVKTGFFLPKTSYAYSLAAVRDKVDPKCDLGFPRSAEEYDARLGGVIKKTGLVTDASMQYRLSVTESDEEIVFGKNEGETFRPLVSLTCHGSTFLWSQPVKKIEEGFVAQSLFIRHLAGTEAIPYVTADGERSNMYVLRTPLNKDKLPEPVLVPWTRHLNASGQILYRVGNSIVSAASNLPALQFEQAGKRVWRVVGTYKDQDVEHGTYFWTDGQLYYSAKAASGPVVQWKPQDNDSMDRVGRVEKKVPEPIQALFSKKSARPTLRGIDWYNLDKDVIQVFQFYRFGKYKPLASEESTGLGLAGEDDADFYLYEQDALAYRAAKKPIGFGLQDDGTVVAGPAASSSGAPGPTVPDFSQPGSYGDVSIGEQPANSPERPRSETVFDYDSSKLTPFQDRDYPVGTVIDAPNGSFGTVPALVLNSSQNLIPGKAGVFSSTNDESDYTTTVMSPFDGRVYDLSPTGQSSNERPLTAYMDEMGLQKSRRNELLAEADALGASGRALSRYGNAIRQETDGYVEKDVLMGGERFVRNVGVDQLDYYKGKNEVNLGPQGEVTYSVLTAQLRGNDAEQTIDAANTNMLQQISTAKTGAKGDEADALVGAMYNEAKFSINRDSAINDMVEKYKVSPEQAAELVDRAQYASRRDQVYDYVFARDDKGKILKTPINMLIKGGRALDDYGRAADTYNQANGNLADSVEILNNVRETDNTASFLDSNGAVLQYGIQRRTQYEAERAQYDRIKAHEQRLAGIANGSVSPVTSYELPGLGIRPQQLSRPSFDPFANLNSASTRPATQTITLPPTQGDMAAYMYGEQWRKTNPGIRVPTPRYDSSTGQFVFPPIRQQ